MSLKSLLIRKGNISFTYEILILAGALGTGLAAAPPLPAASRRMPVAQLSRLRLPLQFEPNRGQWPAPVQYAVRGNGRVLQLVAKGANLAWQSPAQGPSSRLHVLRMRFTGARRLRWHGRQRLPGRINELVGARRQWRRNLPVYGQAVADQLYPGVALRFEGRGGAMEWNLHFAPGATPQTVRLRFQGGNARIESDGSLQVAAGGQKVNWLAPYAWQMRQGRRVPVAVRYTLRRHGEVGFRLGAYDARRELVIDPTLAWATYLGGAGNDQASAVSTDSSGNIYITGFTLSTNFPVSSALQSKSGGSNDAFVTKVNPLGNKLIYSTYLGGSGDDEAAGIAVNSSGNAVVTGFTNSTNFPTTAGALATVAPGGYNAFVAELSAGGSSLLYSTYLGGTGNDYATGLTLDSLGDAYITGYTSSTDFPTTAGVVQPSLKGTVNAYVSELNAAGSALIYSTYLGGSGIDHANGIALDSGGNAYICGFTSSTDFPVTSAAFQTQFGGKYDAFVAELAPGGASLIYATYLGGNADDEANALTVDNAGAAYVTGYTLSTNFPVTIGAYQTTATYGKNVFVTKLSAGGASLDYSTFIGGTGNDIGNAIAVDAQGYAYVAGQTDSPNFPVTPGAMQSTLGGNSDAFLLRLDPVGQTLPFSTYMGGSGVDQANGITLDPSGNVVVVGTTFSVNFPVTSGALQAANAGSADAFAVKFTTGPAAGFSASQIVFPEQAENTTSTARSVTLYNSGEAPLTIASIAASKDFAQTNNCPAVMAPSTSCSISVTFTPSVTTSPDTGTLTVTDNAPGGTQTVALSGTVGTFSLSANPTQQIINPGGTASYTLTFTPANGYVSTTYLYCNGLPSGATCTFTPQQLTLSGDSNATSASTLSIVTSTSAGLPMPPPGSPSRPWLWGAGLLALASLGLAAWRRRGSRRWLGVAALALMSLAAVGCGSNSPANSTPTGTYNVTVNAKDVNGKVIQATQVSLVVQ